VYFLRALDLPLEGTRQVSYGAALALVAAVTWHRRHRREHDPEAAVANRTFR
jgi:hypothetical protein